jgi:hypothetical protein
MIDGTWLAPMMDDLLGGFQFEWCFFPCHLFKERKPVFLWSFPKPLLLLAGTGAFAPVDGNVHRSRLKQNRADGTWIPDRERL